MAKCLKRWTDDPRSATQTGPFTCLRKPNHEGDHAWMNDATGEAARWTQEGELIASVSFGRTVEPQEQQQFSLPAGRAARDAGAAQADSSAAADEWRPGAIAVLRELALSGQPFTADDLVERAGLPLQSETNANNAVGALFSAASKKGLIERMGDTQSKRVAGHARRLSVWRGSRPA